MRRAHVVALAAALVLAGCPGATTTEDTVTPAPVPAAPTAAGTPPCAIPTPSSTGGTATPTTADPVSIPVEDRVVNVTELLTLHDRELRRHSYELSRPGLSVRADPEGPTLEVHAQSAILTARHYVVEGTSYTLVDGPGGQEPYQVHEYDADRLSRDFGAFYSLTGSDWLADALAIAPHRVYGRYPNGGFELRATPDGPVAVDDGSTGDTRSIRSIQSTVTVDRRGIIRGVEQEYEIVADGELVRTVDHSFSVINVGKTVVQRPEWVCIADRNGLFASP
jgi:hypothetical protein